MTPNLRAWIVTPKSCFPETGPPMPFPVPRPVPDPFPVPPITPVSETGVFLGIAGAQLAPPTTVSISNAAALSSPAGSGGASVAKGSSVTVGSSGVCSSISGGWVSATASAAISWETKGSLGTLPLKMATLPKASRKRT